MTAAETRAAAHVRRRLGRKRRQIAAFVLPRLVPEGAVWPPGLLRDPWPFTGHRTLAEVGYEAANEDRSR